MIPLIGFAPDLPPTTPGALLDCENVVPTLRGFRAAHQLTPADFPAIADEVRGAVSVLRLDNQRRFFVGTPDALYEGVSDSWLDRSRSGGYSGGAENRWRFAQFGNATLATNTADPIQVSTSAEFEDIPGAPAARIITVASGFVMAFATTHQDNGDNPDMWWCSALYNHMDWTPDIATQCANGRLIDTPGEIRAGKALGAHVVAYKASSMYLGQYVGPPIIWSWQQVPGEIGALSQESVVDIDTAHVFIGLDDFWIYDGSRPVSIGAPVREWFFKTAHPSYLHRTLGYFDRFAGIVYWYFASNQSTGELDSCVCYNVKTQRWGKVTRSIQAPVEYIASGVTYDDLGDLYDTYDDIASISYDSPEWFAGGEQAAVFGTDGQLYLLGAGGMPCSMTLWEVGDDSQYTTLSRVRARFISAPDSGGLQAYYRAVQGGPLSVGPTATYQDGKFDLLWSARWHRVKLNFTGQAEVAAVNFELVPDGTR